MPKRISVRGVPTELARRIAKIAQVRNQSVNATVLELLERATGIDDAHRK